MNVLVERLRSIDKSIIRLTAERLKVLAEIAKLSVIIENYETYRVRHERAISERTAGQ